MESSDPAGGIILIILFLLIYFLPSLFGVGKRNSGAIFALNLLLGWTLIGWVVSLVWALTKDAPNTAAPPPTAPWICARCRAPLNRGQAFCHVCGMSIVWPP